MMNFNRPNQKPSINNVITERHTIPVKVERFFTDNNGIILPVTDPLIIGAGLNIAWPAFIFGEFDRQGGYYIANKICSPRVGEFLTSFVNGSPQTSSSILGITPLNQLQGRLRKGDIVQVYADNILAPNYYVWIVLSHSTAALASILSNVKSEQRDNRHGRLIVSSIKYYYKNDLQLNEALHVTIADNLGTYLDDSLQPNIFKNTMVAQPGLIHLEVGFDFNQFMGLNFYLVPSVDNVSFDFEILNIV